MADIREKFPIAPSSVWQDMVGSYRANPPLRDSIQADVAIIGAGFTGLATAYELKKTEPGLNVAIFEAKEVGYGASGRNGSFAMTVSGLGFGVTAKLHGKQFLQDSHRYMMRAVDCLDDLIQSENLDCDRIRPGFLRVATTEGYIKRLQEDVALMNSLGFGDIYWLDTEDVRERVNSTYYLGAMWEPRLLLVNPLKLARTEKRLVERIGVRVFESSPVLSVDYDSRWRLKTPDGQISAEKIVFATNAYSHLISPLRRKQVPAFTYMIATEPLTDKQIADIGWHGLEGVEDARNLIHYYRLTPDRRLIMGGGPVGLSWANDLQADNSQTAWQHLTRHVRLLFPTLNNIKVTHRWGGPFSVTLDLTPALGYMGGERAVFSLGCIGHGVSMSHLNAKVLRDLILERQSELLDSPFVNRRIIPWPPEPLRILVAGGLRAYLKLEDWWYERHLPRGY